jgi:uncharacterized protein YdaU (DUF1376 family)
MAAIPWMALYPSDYLADTAHLTRAQSGSYMFLLMNYWQTGRALDNTDDRLALVARMTPEEWQSEKAILGEFFQIKKNKWTHKRVEVEIQKVLVKSVKNSENGRKGAETRLKTVKRSPSERLANAKRTLSHTDTDTDTDKRKELVQISFGRFWEIYPRRDGKKKAQEAFEKAMAKTDSETILEGVGRYKKFLKTSTQEIAMAATWLNQERWNDEPAPARNVVQPGVIMSPTYTPPRLQEGDLPSGGIPMPSEIRTIALGKAV